MSINDKDLNLSLLASSPDQISVLKAFGSLNTSATTSPAAASSPLSFPSTPAVPATYHYDKIFYSFDDTTTSPLSSYYGGYGNSMTTNGDYLFISSSLSSSFTSSPPAPPSSSSETPAFPPLPSPPVIVTSKIYVYRRGFGIESKSWELVTTVEDPSLSLASPSSPLSFSDGFGSVMKATKQFLFVASPSDSSISYQNGKVFIYDLMKLSDYPLYPKPPPPPSGFSSGSSSGRPSTPLAVPPPPLPFVIKPIILQGNDNKEKFGSSLSINDDFLVVGAPGSLYGSVYLYQSK
jgi:hypothetical protein